MFKQISSTGPSPATLSFPCAWMQELQFNGLSQRCFKRSKMKAAAIAHEASSVLAKTQELLVQGEVSIGFPGPCCKAPDYVHRSSDAALHQHLHGPLRVVAAAAHHADRRNGHSAVIMQPRLLTITPGCHELPNAVDVFLECLSPVLIKGEAARPCTPNSPGNELQEVVVCCCEAGSTPSATS